MDVMYLEQAPFPIIIVRIKDGTLRYGNQKAQRQLGFTSDQGVGLSAAEFYENPSERDHFLALLNQDKFINDYEIRLLNWNKKPYWALMSASFTTYEGEPAIMVSINDITAKKEAEIALQNERFLLNERLKERECLLSAIELTNDDDKPIEVILRHLIEVIREGWQHPEQTFVRIQYDESIYETSAFEITPWMIIKEGITLSDGYVKLSIAYKSPDSDVIQKPFFDEEVDLAQTLLERIIEMINRRKRISAVREHEALINLMFDQSLESIALVDPSTGRFTSFNTATHMGLGYSRSEFEKISVADFQADHSSEVIGKNIERALSGEVVTFETRHKRKNGDIQEAVVTISRIIFREQPYLCVIWRDVTEHNLQLKKLRALSRAVEQSPVSIVITNLEGNIEYANPKACKTTGYTLEELLGNNPRVLKSGETSPSEYKVIWEHLSNGEEWKGIFHNKRKNGDLYWESSQITPIVDDSGKFVQYLAIKEDITERKRIEEDLLKFRTILEQANYGAAVSTMDETLVYVNPAYAKMHGYTVDELIGKQVKSLYNENQWKKVSVLLEQLRITGNFISNEVFRSRKDGSIFPSFMSGNLVINENSQPEYIAVTVVDTSEIKQKELEIQKWKMAIEQSPVAAVITDLDGVIQYASPAFEQITGYTQTEVIGMHTRVLKSGQTSDAVYKNLWQTITSGKMWKGEWVNRRKNGELYYEYASITPIFDQEGHTVNYLAIKEDITMQKQAVQDRIDRETAEASNRAKSAFLSNMSHEIRTPLNAVIGFAQLLNRDSSITDKQSRQVQSIIRSGEHLIGLINDILDLSRIESGHTNLSAIDFNIHELIDDIGMMFQLRASEKNLKLFVETDPDVPLHINADEAKLRQVLINLVGNAVKFTESGNILLRTFVQRDYKDTNKKMHLVIVVEDTGPGIANEDLKRIFSSFYQTRSGAKYGGTGLGLAISKNLIELMGGSISVESRVGIGSSFNFNIPVTEAENTAEKSRKKPEAIIGISPMSGTFRVLIADDRVENREILGELLASVGFEVQQVENGKEALSVFHSWHPHAILLDMSMPEMDGYEATRVIKSTEEGRNTLIVAVTASVFESDVDKVMACGVDYYIRKPFKAEEIFAVLENLPGLSYLTSESIPEKVEQNLEVMNETTDLSQEMIDQMIEAVTHGDILTLRKMISELRSVNPLLSEKLKGFVSNYDYEAILNLLNSKGQ